IVCFAVHDAAANAQHGFGSNLIGRTEPWSEGIRIVLRECTVALSRSVSFKNDPAGKAAGSRVRRSGADTEHVAAMFFQVSLKVIAQAVIEREFSIHFPVVLEEKRHGMVPRSQSGRNAVVAAVGRANENAGVIESYAGGERCALKRRESRLRWTVEHVP